MAENTNIYTGGVVIAGDLEIGAVGKAADARLTVKNPTGLSELVSAKKVYDGMIVYCESTKTYHQCSVEWDANMNITASSWKQVEYKSLEELKALIAQESTAAMEFKGTITDAKLPTTGNKGDLYKIAQKEVEIPAQKNAEKDAEGKEFAVTAKPGDSIVCEVVTVDNVETIKWYLIPSGDDIEDTWRAIKVNGNEVLGNGTTTNPVDFQQGANVTITEVGGVVTIAAKDTHYESKLVAASSATNAVDENTENEYTYLNLVENNVVKSSHKIVGTGGITVIHTVDGGGNGDEQENVITIHATEAKEYSGSEGDEINIAVTDGIISASLDSTFKDTLATKRYVDDSLDNVDLTNYYTKDEVDAVADELTKQSIAVLAETQKYTDEAVGNMSAYDLQEANVGADKDGNEVRYFVLDCNW